MMWSKLLILVIFSAPYLASVRTEDAKKPKPGLLCAGCRATLKEIEKVVQKKLGRTEHSIDVIVLNSIAKVCNLDNFKVYNYIPPQMVTACKYFLDEYTEVFYDPFVKHLEEKATHKTIVDDICNERTELCVGVDDYKGSDKHRQFGEAANKIGTGEANQVYQDTVEGVRYNPDEL